MPPKQSQSMPRIEYAVLEEADRRAHVRQLLGQAETDHYRATVTLATLKAQEGPNKAAAVRDQTLGVRQLAQTVQKLQALYAQLGGDAADAGDEDA